MKKTYQRPQLSVVLLDSASMLATSSLPASGNENTPEQNSNAFEFGQSFDDENDD